MRGRNMSDQVEASPRFYILKLAEVQFTVKKLAEQLEKVEKAQEQTLFIVETYKDMFARLYRATTRADRV